MARADSANHSLTQANKKAGSAKASRMVSVELRKTKKYKADFNYASQRCRAAVQHHLALQEEQLLSAGPRKFFAYAARQLHAHDACITLDTVTGHTSSPADVCSIFCDEFTKNFDTPSTKETQSVSPTYNCDSTFSASAACLTNINVDVTSVRLALIQLRDSAAGPDGLPAIFFKRLASWLAMPLTVLYQQSIQQAVIPDDWRQAKVVSLYKGKGERSSPSSYRGISLTSVASKVLERIVVDCMRDYLLNNSLINDAQHGFMPRRSVVTNLLQSDELISQSLNNSIPCDVITLDFMRAFDKVNHVIVRTKLQSLGIGGTLLDWLTDFLKGRTQFVSYRGAMSTAISVTSGVVQGSVVGPLLFLVMINDLPLQVTSLNMVLYADDAKAIGPASSVRDCRRNQEDLDALFRWSVANRLPLSLPKCQCLHLGLHNANYDYALGGAPVASVKQCMDLGLLRTSDFAYSAHISSIVCKASQSAGMLFRAFSSRNKSFLKKLYIAYVRPKLEFASEVWNPTTIRLQNDLERVQRRFTKRLCGTTAMSYEERLAHLHLPSLQVRRRRADFIMAYKILHGAVDISADSIGLKVQSSAATRSNGLDLLFHKPNNNNNRRIFKFRIAEPWKKLPAAAKSALSLNTFKKYI
jgi:hypothetical protein